MRLDLSASALALIVIASTANALPSLQTEPGTFASSQEAQRNMPAPPTRCSGAAGADRCIATVIPLYRPEGRRWAGFWAEASMSIECVDGATAHWRVDCAAPDAVRTVIIPAAENCVVDRAEGRARCTPQARPARPYRPTPVP